MDDGELRQLPMTRGYSSPIGWRARCSGVTHARSNAFGCLQLPKDLTQKGKPMRLSRAGGIGAIAVCLAVAVSAQAPSFSRADYRSASGPRGVVAGDFNRDGASDLALANNGEKSVTILINQTGSGRGFVVAQRISLG